MGRTYRLLSAHDVAVGAASELSDTAPDACYAVRLLATVDCRVAIGAGPVAGPGDCLLLAHVEREFQCGAGEQIAVIRESQNGALNVSWLI